MMTRDTKPRAFPGRILIVGFGSIGQGVLPLILRHITIPPDRITIVTADKRGETVAAKYGVRFIIKPLKPENHREILREHVGPGDFLVNLSVDVSSIALIEWCREVGALYIDTCVEPWAGGYTDPSLSPSSRSNYALRESVLKLKGKGPTAVVTHGANPGLVSHLMKRALLNLARDTGVETDVPATREAWADLARRLSVKVVHIAERDTQVSDQRKQPGEFVNTWSIDGFVGEGCQPAELGWGTHEGELPPDGRRHDFGSDAAIWLTRPGASTRVRTWTPLAGPIHGFLITHSESISIADYFTARENGTVVYRPTVHYAYHPCDDAVLSLHELAGREFKQQERQRLMMDEIVSGVDELGVLLLGHAKNAYWYGSKLSIAEARALAPHNNATSLQVTSTVLAAMFWAMDNPDKGVVEPDEIDHRAILDVAGPYLGEMVGVYGDWNPLAGRGKLFAEDLDWDEPWKFKNIRVM